MVVPIRLLFLLCTLPSFFFLGPFFSELPPRNEEKNLPAFRKRGVKRHLLHSFCIPLLAAGIRQKLVAKRLSPPRCKMSPLEITTILAFRKTMLSAVLTNTLWAIIKIWRIPASSCDRDAIEYFSLVKVSFLSPLLSLAAEKCIFFLFGRRRQEHQVFVKCF